MTLLPAYWDEEPHFRAVVVGPPMPPKKLGECPGSGFGSRTKVATWFAVQVLRGEAQAK
jgi:hypothetical protein